MPAPGPYGRLLTHKFRSTWFSELTNEPVSPVEEFGQDSSSCTRDFIISWPDRFQAVIDFLGYPEVKESGGSKYLSRIVPHFHPQFSFNGISYLPAVKITRIEPYRVPPGDGSGMRTGSGNTAMAAYGLGKMTVLYQTVPWDILDDPNTTQSISGSGPDEARWERYVVVRCKPCNQGLTVGQDNLKFLDGTPVLGSRPKYLNRKSIQVTWVQVPRECVGDRVINPSAPSYPIEECLGCINSDTILGVSDINEVGVSDVFDEGTLLLQDVEIEPHRSPYGPRTYDITYYFEWAREGHHKLLKTTGGTKFEFLEAIYKEASGSNISAKDDGKSLFDWREFAPLFRPPE